MKKISPQPGILILTVFLFSQIAFAQSSPLSDEAAPPPHAISETQVVLTQETVKQETTTQETSPAKAKDSEPTPELYLNLPEPELPVINLDSTQESQGSSILPKNAQPNIDTNALSEELLAPVLGNQFKIILVVFLGAITGTLLTILIMYLIRTVRKRAE
jgi:hypothetical protein